MQLKNNITAVHQFTVNSSYGDAVTNSTLFIQALLKQNNIEGKIYAGYVAPKLYKYIKPPVRLKPKETDVILIHHALGHDLADWLIQLPGRKIIVYHNITPAHFFPDNQLAQADIKRGHQQLKQFFQAGIQDAISISDYNKQDLLQAGFSRISTIPLLIDLEKILEKPWNKKLVAIENQIPTILFVGRISPNKCQHQLIEVANYLRKYRRTPFQMLIVGGYTKTDSYYQNLIKKIDQYALKDWVQITGKIPEVDLYAWYRTASCFLCLSEHEGFGVPIAEAMAFGVPVIGFDAANVPYLLKDSGLTVKEKNLPAIAALVKVLLEEPQYRQTIIDAQKKQVNQLNTNVLSQKLGNYLDSLIF